MRKPPKKPAAPKEEAAPYKPALPKAQECYEASLAALAATDIGEASELMAAKIAEATKEGYFVTILQPLEHLVAEKLSIELEALGYWTGVFNSNVGIPVEGGSFKPGASLHVNWKQMPGNTRDKHTV